MAFTVQTYIGNNVEVYRNAPIRVLFEATIDTADPDLVNPYVKIDTLNLLDIDSDADEPEEFKDVTVPLSKDSTGQWVGYVYGIVPETEVTITLTGSTNSDNVTGTLNTTDVPVNASTGIRITPVLPLTPTMETASSDNLTPEDDTDGKHTKLLSIKIEYKDANKIMVPYENYVVEWHAAIHADFNDRFNIYGSEDAKNTLTPYSIGKIIYYRTTTNEDGIAKFYLVSKKKMASDRITCYVSRSISKLFGNITSVSLDPDQASYSLSSPDLGWPFAQIDLNATKAKKFRVTVRYGSRTGDTVYVYLNGALNSAHEVNSSDELIYDSISRFNIYSTTFPTKDDSKENILLYAVAQEGAVRTSAQNWFKASGKPGPAEPDDVDRVLPAPFLKGKADTINSDLIKGGLYIFAAKKDKDGNFICEDGDTITVRIYVNAFVDGTNTPKIGVVESLPYTIDQKTIDGADENFAMIISEKSIKGYDSDRDGHTGTAQIEYFVTKPDKSVTYSFLDICRIDTVPPHNKTLSSDK